MVDMQMSKDCPECGYNQNPLAVECRNCGSDLTDVKPAYH